MLLEPLFAWPDPSSDSASELVSGALLSGSGLAFRLVGPTRCTRCAGARSAARAPGGAAWSRSGSTCCRSPSRASLHVPGYDSAGGSPAGRSRFTLGPQWSVDECLSWLLSRLGLSTPSPCRRFAGTPSARFARQVFRLLRPRARSPSASPRAICPALAGPVRHCIRGALLPSARALRCARLVGLVICAPLLGTTLDRLPSTGWGAACRARRWRALCWRVSRSVVASRDP